LIEPVGLATVPPAASAVDPEATEPQPDTAASDTSGSRTNGTRRLRLKPDTNRYPPTCEWTEDVRDLDQLGRIAITLATSSGVLYSPTNTPCCWRR
jgi:hypothetical protein